MRRRAFTLVEMLVVVAIIGILAALLLPAMAMARARARQAQCIANLKQIGEAMSMYSDQWGGFLPRGRQAGGYGPLTALLPNLGNDPLFNAINFSYPYYHVVNTTALNNQQALFLCPSDERTLVPGNPLMGRASYVANSGSGLRPDRGRVAQDRIIDPSNVFYETDGVFYSGERRLGGHEQVLRQSVRDGHENTIAMSETTMGANRGTVNSVVSETQGATRYLFLAINGVGGDGIPGTFDDGPYTDPTFVPTFSTGLRQVSWMAAFYGNGMYNHLKAPNSNDLDEVLATPAVSLQRYPAIIGDVFDDDGINAPDGSVLRLSRGNVGARSMHSRQVDVLFVSGRAVQINDNIDPTVWMALSTRASNEVVPQF